MISGRALVHAQSIGVTYAGTIPALADINFEIGSGQFVSIVGPSGCGKSTLLRLIAGLVQPTSGQITVAGDRPAVARKAARLSFVFQDATLLPWRSVRGNVQLPLELERRPRQDRGGMVSRIVNVVGLSEFERRYPNELSGGMKMRVSLARALVTEPELLLLDEPFGALDDMTRQMLNEELTRLWAERGWTGIFVTHNISEAVFLSQRVLVMSARPGRIVADIPVPFESPRRPELRSQAEFGRLIGEVSTCLRRTEA